MASKRVRAESLPGGMLASDSREALEALRVRVVEALSEAKPGEVAALARQLTIIIERLGDLAPVEVDFVDDLARVRAERIAGADGSGRSSGRVGRGG